MNIEVNQQSLRAALPGRRRTRRCLDSFLISVVLPTVFVFLYLALIASPRHGTEFRYSVFASTAGTPNNGDYVGTQQAAPSVRSDYIVNDYVASRQAVEDLRGTINLEAMARGVGFDPLFHF